MKGLKPIRLVLSALAILLATNATLSPQKVMAADSAPPTAAGLLQKMASEVSDDCAPDAVPSVASGVEVSDLQRQLFDAVKAEIADRLNAPAPSPSANAGARATSALRDIEQWSVKYNKSWPDEDRFHFKVLELPPAVLIEMSYRSHATLVLFGSFNLNKNETVEPGTKWREVDFADPGSPPSEIALFPLHRGPTGHPRFMAQVWNSGCAGSLGEDYYGYEWNPDQGQSSNEIIKIEGAQGLDDSASTHVGTLSTAGNTIQLPYCFFSALDTWDNPTLCAADSFDLSGDDPAFIGRIYNSPDLVTVAKAIEYAEVHDYVALRGYCASDSVAKLLVRKIPPYLFADTLDTVKAGPMHETVTIADGDFRFDLIKRQGRWLVERLRVPDRG
jgi:hypothetical protein